jgi:predicted kinase
VHVVVSGPPGSGKSTLAAPLAAELGLALVAKDTIKDALMSVLPVPDVESSKLLGRAAIAAMLAVAAETPRGSVLDCNFHRTLATGALRRLPGAIVEVFCRCDRDVAATRYLARAASRHPGHFDSTRNIDELWTDEVAHPVAGGWPVLEVDTNQPVDATSVAASIPLPDLVNLPSSRDVGGRDE